MAKIKPKTTEKAVDIRDQKVTKLIFVVQDLVTKDKEVVAVISGDVHVTRGGKKEVVSFQMALDSNKDFQRHIQSLTTEALALNAITKQKRGKPSRTA